MTTQVIIVEDDTDSADILTEYLEMREIKVVAKAKNGKEAVDFYSKLKPEVVLLDIIMPGYDGFYALEKIKAIDNNAKIIFVTAATNATTQAKIFQANVDGIIFKPFKMDYLLETIDIVKNGGKRIPKTTSAQI